MNTFDRPEAGQARDQGAAARAWEAAVLGAVLVAVAVVLTHGIARGEFNLNNDEPVHAATGRNVADFLTDRPFAHPVNYTLKYYAQYPALGYVHWPPFFYVVEGTMFYLFGPSVVIARLTVLFFALLAATFWFKTVKDLENIWTAVATTLSLAWLPSVLLYEKSVMLEIPSMAFCLAGSYYWISYLRTNSRRSLYLFALAASLALLTKQNSIYLLPFCALSVLAAGKWRQVLTRITLKALACSAALVVPYYTLMLAMHTRELVAVVTEGSHRVARPWAYYPLTLPNQLGWPLLAASAVGIATSRWWAKRENVAVMLMWILACYGTFSVFAEKFPRYIVYWLPAFVYLAIAPLTSSRIPSRFRPLTFAAVLALLVSQSVKAWTYERPYVCGYRALAQRVMQEPNPGILLYDADLPGDFIFYLREFDPNRRAIVMRKGLYVTNIMKQFGSEELVRTKEQLEQQVAEYGIKYCIVDNEGDFDFGIQETLRDMLQSSQFRLVETFPIESNISSYKGRRLFLYENLEAKPCQARFMRVKMLTLNNTDLLLPLAGGAPGTDARCIAAP